MTLTKGNQHFHERSKNQRVLHSETPVWNIVNKLKWSTTSEAKITKVIYSLEENFFIFISSFRRKLYQSNTKTRYLLITDQTNPLSTSYVNLSLLIKQKIVSWEHPMSNRLKVYPIKLIKSVKPIKQGKSIWKTSILYLVWSKKSSNNFQNCRFPSARRPDDSNSFTMPNLYMATRKPIDRN